MISGFLLKIVIGFAIAAVILFDVGAVVVNFFTLDSKADEIAVTLSTDITSRDIAATDPRMLQDRARALAREAGARLMRADIDKEGVVHIQLRRAADTLILSRIGPLEDWGKATAEATAATT